MSRAMDWSRARRPKETECITQGHDDLARMFRRPPRTRQVSKDDLRRQAAAAAAEWEHKHKPLAS